MNTVKEPIPFKISKLIRRIIDYTYLQDYLTFVTTIEDKDLKKKLSEKGKLQQKIKSKERIDFFMIEINQENFNVCREKVSCGELKLMSANDLQLVLFTPKIWTSLYHIFSGMKIMILEENDKTAHLVNEIGMASSKISYIEEGEIFSDKKPLYILAKERKAWIDQKELDRRNLLAKQAVIEKCQRKLNDIEEMLKISRTVRSVTLMTKIENELKRVKTIADNTDNIELKKRVDEIENDLCSQNARTIS